MNPSCPHPLPLKTNVTEADISAEVSASIDSILGAVSYGAKVEVLKHDLDFVIESIAQAENDYTAQLTRLILFQNVSPSPQVRKTAAQALDKLNWARRSMYQNERLFEIVRAYENRIETQKLDFEVKRFIHFIHENFLDEGIMLVPEERARLHHLQQKEAAALAEFLANLGRLESISKAISELDGLPAERLAAFKLDSNDMGRKVVPLTKPNVSAILRHCHSSNTRRDVYMSSNRIFSNNAIVFKELALLRDETARLLGHASYAAQLQRNYLIRTPEAANAFISKFCCEFSTTVRLDLEALERLKGDKLQIWDLEYYQYQRVTERAVDLGLVAEYFPAQYTISRIMGLFSEILGLQIDRIETTTEKLWHSDVGVYAVREAHTADLVGYLYTDIYPREGKFAGAANFSVQTVSHASAPEICMLPS